MKSIRDLFVNLVEAHFAHYPHRHTQFVDHHLPVQEGCTHLGRDHGRDL